jgi:hypothetical protein
MTPADVRSLIINFMTPRLSVGEAGVRFEKPKGHRPAAASVVEAQAFAEQLRSVLTELAGLSANAAAKELDRRGYATARGGVWTASKVIAVRDRLSMPRVRARRAGAGVALTARISCDLGN